MGTETIGSGFSQSVKDQLKAREALFSAKKRENDQLLYMNSNGAWARLVSSINTLTKEETVALKKFEVGPKDIEGDNTLAYNNVLLGGTKAQTVRTKGGIDTTPNYNPIILNDDQTILAGQPRTNQYNNYASLGFRPSPGIETVSIESKNTYGTLREAKIKITAWTLEDLEVIQALYLRPGYSMLLEWGHSMYITNDGTLKKDGVGSLYNDFLTDSCKTGRQIEEDLSQKREDNDNNYDAMYGYVKNFNWSYRQDGGYDCEVTLISKGSILESMSIKFDPANTLEVKNEKTKDTRELVSPFHKFFHDLAKVKKTSFTENDLIDKLNSKEKGNYSKLQKFNGFWLDLDTSGDLDDFEDRGQFITLGTLLDFYNNYVSPVNPASEDEEDNGKYKLIKYYTGQTDSQPTGPYEQIAKYVTTDSHFSIDPLKGLLPKEFTAPTEITSVSKLLVYGAIAATGGILGVIGLFFTDEIKGALNRSGIGQVNRLDLGPVNKIKKQLNTQIIKGDSDDILNIVISTHYLSTTIDDLLKSETKTDHNMQAFVSRILNTLNDSLGGINDLDQYYNEEHDMWYIIDRKKTPSGDNVGELPSMIPLTGLKSTITNLGISSKISNEIGAQVSIAAQGAGNNYNEDVSTLLEWNSGLIDRTIPIKTITQDEFDKQSEAAEKKAIKKLEKVVEWAEEVTDVFDEFSEGGEGGLLSGWGDVDYEEEDHNNLKSGHKEYTSKYVLDDYYKPKEKPKPPPGVIPVELSFTTIGIGGLKVGQAFTVEKGVLPERYSKYFGFILTGLSHDVSGNKWTTSVKTQFYSIRTTPLDECKETPSPRPETTASTITPEGITTVDPLTGVTATPEQLNELDPAPKINTGRIGGISYSASPVAKKLQGELNFNGLLDLGNLEFIGETQGAARYYINPQTGRPEYMLHPAAAKAWYGWRDEMKSQGVFYRVTSGYRNSQHQGGLDSGRSASPGRSPHGWAGALDFGNLYQVVGGSTNLTTNVNGRIQSPDYTKMAEIGKKYGWYNPWRLSNNGGSMDELWHWEYWGTV